MNSPSLDTLRKKLDSIDSQITRLLSERIEIAKDVGKTKKLHNIPITDLQREKELIEKLQTQISDPVLQEYIRPIYEDIIAACKAPQLLHAHTDFPYTSVGIIGLGLIGGSIAKTLRIKKPSVPVYTLKRAVEQHIVTELADIKELYDTCDLIIIASPIETIVPIARSLASVEKDGKKRTILDVGSVKEAISAEFEKLSTNDLEFVPTHPMAGSELSGLNASKATLFLHNPWIVTPHQHNLQSTIDNVIRLVTFMGSKPVLSNPKDHDKNVAIVSHLIFLISTYLFAFAASDHEEILELAGSGFDSTTRLASGNITMHDQILKQNITNISQALADFLEFIHSHRVDATDSYDFFTAYKTSRDEYIQRKTGV